jgi:sulfatase maturation enzyme AslB (radical SAM superfamily)
MESVVEAGLGPSHDTHFIWLEITGNCQLECGHCYAGSGPGKGHGFVSADKWIETLTEAAAAGVQQVQFIGGEPTSHPALPRLLEHATRLGLRVEVFSNLFSIREHMWQAFVQNGVTLATSYYSVSAEIHDQVTARPGSHERTKANIGEAVRRGISLRVGLIRLTEQQDVDAAIEELVSMGVDPDAIRVDDLRGVGRGRTTDACVTEDELCGQCASGVLAIMPDGAVQPCVFSRDARFAVGSIADQHLTAVLAGERLQQIRQELTTAFRLRGPIGVDCSPAEPKGPHACGPACSPSCVPVGNCNPVVNPPPCNPIGGHPPRPEPPVRPPGPVCSPY